MAKNEITKHVSIANFLNAPATDTFLQDTLSDKKAEFVSNLITMCDGDSNLTACDPGKLMKCAMNATALNLPLNKNLGYAYVIPYKGIPSFQIGYKGLIQLAIRTGAYRYINAVEIREGEIKENRITGKVEFVKEQPTKKVVGYIAYLELMSGFSASLYMSNEKIEAHAVKFSKMYAADKKYSTAKSKWSDTHSRPKMALKTVLKSLLGTYGLMTTEFAKAFATDNENVEAEPNNRSFTEAEIMPQGEPETTSPTGMKATPEDFPI